MGKLRKDSTDDFPVGSRDGGVGYVLIYDEPVEETRRKLVSDPTEVEPKDYEYERVTEEVSWRHYKSTKGEKEKLLSHLQDVDDYDDVTLLGYWAGQWRTDMHLLQLPQFVDRLESADL